MMKAVLRHMSGLDRELLLNQGEEAYKAPFYRDGDFSDFKAYKPLNLKSFSMWIDLCLAGDDDDGPGCDDFGFTLLTPDRVYELLQYEKPYNGRFLAFVEEYDADLLIDYVTGILSKYEADSWEELAGNLGRHFQWEYEGHPVDAEGRLLT